MKATSIKALIAVFTVASFIVGLSSCSSADPALIPATEKPSSILPSSKYASAPALDLRLSAWPYPYPVKEFNTSLQGSPVTMVYMDVPAFGRQRGTVLLFHGKNFSSDYWALTIAGLTKSGYRVIAPDQIGFGKSSKPNVTYHFDDLAKNTYQLLSSLKIKNVSVIANSMGGMLAVRFARIYPNVVHKLVLENPLGLEDYSTYIPPQTNDNLLKLEMAQTEASYRKFMQSYFPNWKPDYDKFVEVYVRVQKGPDYPTFALTSVLTYQMIAEKPVVNDFPLLNMPTLLIIGQRDRTVFGRRFAPPETVKSLGNFPELGRKTSKIIPNATLVPIENVGHAPHIEVPDFYIDTVVNFLKSPS